MSEKFMPGQWVDWVDGVGDVVQRCQIVEKSDAPFVSGDKLIQCWVVRFHDGTTGTIAEYGLRPVRLHT